MKIYPLPFEIRECWTLGFVLLTYLLYALYAARDAMRVRYPGFRNPLDIECVFFSLFLSVLMVSSLSAALETTPSSVQKGPSLYSRQAILIDLTTGEVLFEKNADERMPPSSMSKIMTTYLVFEELKAGRLKMTDTFPVSEKAWRKKGSKMFLKLHSQVSVADLLRGAIVQSGNDACITLAEGLAGSEETFATQMMQVAKEIGLSNSNFVNATGWPDDNHYATARDLALITRKLIEKFPDYYPLYAEREFTYNAIRQMNRNPLLASFPGADGLKTGATDAGGFGLIGSALQGERRLIMVINGAESKKKRAIDSKALMQWGFSNFVSSRLYNRDQVIDQADVWLGHKPRVGLKVARNVNITLPRQDIKNLKVDLVYQGPVAAPVQAGQKIGNLIVSMPNKPDMVIPVVAAESIGKAGFLSKIEAVFSYFFIRSS